MEKNYKVSFTITLPIEILSKLDEVCREKNTNRGNIVEKGLSFMFEEQSKKR